MSHKGKRHFSKRPITLRGTLSRRILFTAFRSRIAKVVFWRLGPPARPTDLRTLIGAGIRADETGGLPFRRMVWVETAGHQ